VVGRTDEPRGRRRTLWLGIVRLAHVSAFEEAAMPRFVVSEFLTLDGVMQGPGAPDEDRSGGFDRGGWQMDYFDTALGKFVTDGFESAGGLLLGRRTYDIFAAYWPHQSSDNAIAPTMNAFRKYVVSNTLTEPLAWQNSTLIAGDVPARLAELRREPGKELLVIGSGGLVQTLMGQGLVDEYRLMVHPLVLGKGKRLFRDPDAMARLDLVESRATENGILLLVYRPSLHG
jgi:dihydrofolate reductase